MKKMFTLIASVVLFTSAFAKYNNGNQRPDREKDYAYNDRNNDDRNYNGNNRYDFRNRERDAKIAAINREYDRRISAVNNKWFMSRYKKEAIIHSLQDQRSNEIRMVYARYSQKENHFDGNGPGRKW